MVFDVHPFIHLSIHLSTYLPIYLGNRQSMSVLTRLRLTAVAEADTEEEERSSTQRIAATGQTVSGSVTGRVASSNVNAISTTQSGKRRYLYKSDPSSAMSSKGAGSKNNGAKSGRFINNDINGKQSDDATAITMWMKRYSNNNNNNNNSSGSDSSSYYQPALRIQALYRGYVTRCAVGVMIENMIDSGELVL